MRKAVVIVAGGKGLRMGTDIPKQFLPVGGKPVLMRTIERFYGCDPSMQIVLVLPKTQQDYWARLCADYAFGVPHTVADGGETRFHSVKSGLALVDADLVAVHDGVRPFVSDEVIVRCFEAAAQDGAAVPVTDVYETVRHLTESGSETVPRSDYKLVQTPQAFSATLLKEAYSQPYRDFFTDDASVVESFGHGVTLVEGCRENIKLTTPYDMMLAECLAASV